MSAVGRQKRVSPAAITALKGERPIVCLTAYTTPIARLLDPHCDLLLVGDSLGMVLYGMESTIGVTTEMMIGHGKAVMRAATHACVIVDLPFGAYQESREQAFRTAARIMMETGCDGVKLEGGEEMAETVAFLVKRGIPVFGHVGLMPQLVNTTGGYRSLGRSEKEADKIRRDARAISDAGAFAMVIEGTIEPLAREITAAVAMTEATDRSRPRRMMTKAWPITTMPSGATCSSMLEMLEPDKNAGDTMPETAISATRKIGRA